jgi:glycosyltransferase involved in cell wall biosynthesis
MTEPLVSICIPAYKKPEYVIRAIQSIINQTYKNVEVIISDDSPNQDIKIAIQPYISELNINYYHNKPALKSPINWNNALSKATGEFIMLLHQDDWFDSIQAISTFVVAFNSKQDVNFVFCKNTAIQPTGEKITLQAIQGLLSTMSARPKHLLRANVIGPPSNVMIRKNALIKYDEDYIWLVDVDYYVRLLEAGNKYVYLDQHLVSIGLHEDQTTVFCRNNEDVIVKENIWLAHKMGTKAFDDILIYDYYWRLLRNYRIRSIADLHQMGLVDQMILPIIIKMLKVQVLFPLSLLRFGPFSKMLMTCNYLLRPRF